MEMTQTPLPKTMSQKEEEGVVKTNTLNFWSASYENHEPR